MTEAHQIPNQMPGDLAPADSRAKAVEMVRRRVGYYEGITALAFYFIRKLVAMHGGNIADVAREMDVAPKTVRATLQLQPLLGGMEALHVAEAWATRLAAEGATYRQATQLFRRSLIDAAIEVCGGNKHAAARRLRIHVNTIKNAIAAQESYRRPAVVNRRTA